jgi:hypothetical protein
MMLRFNLFVTLCLVFIFSSLCAGAEDVNFSGVWVFNDGKSDFGESNRRRADLKLSIKQEGNTLSVERVRQNRSGEENTTTEKFTLDGKECKNIGSRDREKTSVVKWTDDKKGLMITSNMAYQREGETIEVKTVEILILSEDGMVLTIDYTSTSSRGERKSKLVYNKQVEKS